MNKNVSSLRLRACDTGFGFTQLLRIKFWTIHFGIDRSLGELQRFNGYMSGDVKHAHREFFLDTLSADESLRELLFDISELQRYFSIMYGTPLHDIRTRVWNDHLWERTYSGEHINFDTATETLYRPSFN